ncbi:hypothetical protein [Marinobacterium aestuariivivens]|uniref:Phage tail collar domain-containing protein n=1 Tax=Marinobacterium aestuariivivens TaxID=1698799 RepID=A0ABW1ZWW2_9GAMM
MITIKGIGFTDDPLVMLGEFGELNLESASDTLIQAYIPAGATPGDYLLTVMPISNPEMASNFALTISAAPSHLIAFFAMDECPSGWSELAEAQGRVIVGLPDGGTSFGLVGSALADLENRNHDHSFNFNGGNTANAGSHNHVGTAAANGAHDHGATTGITNGTFAADDTGGFVTETVTVDHNHTIDPSVTHEHVVSTEDNGSHSHSFDGGAGNTGDASTSMVMPYLQLLACEKD